MRDQEKSQRRFGLSIGKVTLGAELKSTINAMKPGDVRYFKFRKRVILIRYKRDGELTVLDLNDGSELFRG